MEIGMPHISFINKKELFAKGFLSILGFANKTGYFHNTCFRIQRNKILINRPAENTHNPLPEISGHKMVNLRTIMMHNKLDTGM